MKQKLIEGLKVRLLSVELKHTKFYLIKHDDWHILYEDRTFDVLNIPYPSEPKLIGKLTDITESQCEELVEWIEEPQYYRDYRKGGWQGDITAKESFFSKLEADEVYFENPLGKKPHLGMFIEQRGNCVEDYDKAFKRWQEEESKVWDKERCWLFEIIS